MKHRKKRFVISGIILITLFLTACGPTGTEAPVVAPLKGGVEPPLVNDRPDYPLALTGGIWQWLGSQTNDQFTLANDPSRYEVEFKPDGSLGIRADCNTIQSSYELTEPNNIRIQELGASTMAMCPPDSQGEEFYRQLVQAASYEFSTTNLALKLADDITVMTFSPQPIAILPTPVPGEPFATANNNVNVRSGPGKDYTIYGVMQAGLGAQVIGVSEDGGWWALSVPIAASQTGWVSASLVTTGNVDGVPTLPAPPLPPSVETVEPGPDDPQATITEPTYLREGPGELYPAYGVIPSGEIGLVLGRDQYSTYWVVRVDPKSVSAGFAWVEAAHTQTKNTELVPVIQAPVAPPMPEPLPPPSGNLPLATALTAVNLRSGPSTQYSVLGVMQAGDSSEIAGRSQDGGWWQVRVLASTSPDGLAWVSAAYVNAVNAEGAPVVQAPPLPPDIVAPKPPEQIPDSGYVMTVEVLNVRAGPGNMFESYGKIPSGSILQVTGRSGNWLAVNFPGVPGGIGWISGNYVVPHSGLVAVPLSP